MAPRPWGVETATAQGEIIGRRHYGRKALPPGGGGGRNPTRELFDTLLLWRGTVVLDANGEARIDVPLERFAHQLPAGGDRRRGGRPLRQRQRQRARHAGPADAAAACAPLARQGDRFDAGFTLRNTTARAMTVQATLAGSSSGGRRRWTFAPQTVALAAGAAQRSALARAGAGATPRASSGRPRPRRAAAATAGARPRAGRAGGGARRAGARLAGLAAAAAGHADAAGGAAGRRPAGQSAQRRGGTAAAARRRPARPAPLLRDLPLHLPGAAGLARDRLARRRGLGRAARRGRRLPGQRRPGRLLPARARRCRRVAATASPPTC